MEIALNVSLSVNYKGVYMNTFYQNCRQRVITPYINMEPKAHLRIMSNTHTHSERERERERDRYVCTSNIHTHTGRHIYIT